MGRAGTPVVTVPPLRVVVADDDGDIRLLVGIAVRKAGLDLVASAHDGDDAWALVIGMAPDLVVADVSMPGMTGLDLCRLVRAEPALSATRVVLLSAAVDDASRQAGLDAGATDYLIKPFSPRELAYRLVQLATHIEARL